MVAPANKSSGMKTLKRLKKLKAKAKLENEVVEINFVDELKERGNKLMIGCISSIMYGNMIIKEDDK
jgi:spore germination protein GerM